ncbi:hypothetical protein VP01_2416g4 [Puccinia sorghi]|uniref:Uncharacterized protein n=1 Tax=Puccinia sorghi TaxID=27349 RepID=A0A0L6V6K7_9BASI|nr:hypothetical protein VP01_2416g4 [Puccinia sorghi]
MSHCMFINKCCISNCFLDYDFTSLCHESPQTIVNPPIKPCQKAKALPSPECLKCPSIIRSFKNLGLRGFGDFCFYGQILNNTKIFLFLIISVVFYVLIKKWLLGPESHDRMTNITERKPNWKKLTYFSVAQLFICQPPKLSLSPGLQFELRMNLVVPCVDLKLKNHPDNLKDHKENDLIHAQGLISYGHHFMNLIFFFYVMITLKMWIKVFLVSLHQFLNPKSKVSINPDNPNHRSLTKPTPLSQKIKICCAAWLSTNLKILKCQPNILCKPIPSFSSLEDEPLLLPLSPKPVFQFAKATVLVFCLCVFLNDRGKTLPAACILSVQNNNMLYISKPISPLDYSSKQFDCIKAKGFFILWQLSYQRVVVGFQKISTKLGTKFTKIRLNFITYNQHTTALMYFLEERRSELKSGIFMMPCITITQVTGCHFVIRMYSTYAYAELCCFLFLTEIYIIPHYSIHPVSSRIYLLFQSQLVPSTSNSVMIPAEKRYSWVNIFGFCGGATGERMLDLQRKTQILKGDFFTVDSQFLDIQNFQWISFRIFHLYLYLGWQCPVVLKPPGNMRTGMTPHPAIYILRQEHSFTRTPEPSSSPRTGLNTLIIEICSQRILKDSENHSKDPRIRIRSPYHPRLPPYSRA